MASTINVPLSCYSMIIFMRADSVAVGTKHNPVSYTHLDVYKRQVLEEDLKNTMDRNSDQR